MTTQPKQVLKFMEKMDLSNHFNIHKSKALFREVRKLLKHQKEREAQKEDNFNIFGILRLTSDEDFLHTRILGDLLNPKGTHGLGERPLVSFLAIVTNGFVDKFNPQKASVEIEKSIGKVNLKKKTGGRLDLFVSDNEGNMITIENKIFAKDQKVQIQRYVNYKRGQNKVLYLTLHGKEPADYSKGELTTGIDYLSISYKKDILNWLEECQKEAYAKPLLRETLKQYVNTIKKMTHKIDDKDKEEFEELFIEYLDEVQTIMRNISVLDDIRDRLRKAVIKGLEKHENGLFNKYFDFYAGSATNKLYAQLWIKPKDVELPAFGIETFSGDSNANIGGKLFVGMKGNLLSEDQLSELNKISNYWPHHEVIKYKGKPVHLADAKILKLIASKDSKGFIELTESIVDQASTFIVKSLQTVGYKLQT